MRDLVVSQGLAQPLVSHHLAGLLRAGLVEVRRADGFRIYAVSLEGMAAARALFSELLDPERVGPLGRPGGNAACCR